MRLVLLSVLLAAPIGGPAGAETPSFARDISPVLRVNCAVCHLTGQEAGNLALHPKAAWKSLVGRKSAESPHLIVAPGAAAKSYLLMKLEGTHLSNGGSGERMPFGANPLNPDVIARIRVWIESGAKDN